MKNFTLLFIAIASIFSLGCFAQRSARFPVSVKMENAQLKFDGKSSGDGLVVVSYHVEERINMPFGGRVTTYNVPSLDLVSKIELGPNNTRIVTAKYGKAKAVAMSGLKLQQLTFSSVPLTPTIQAADIKLIAPDVRPKFVNIDILSTYERVLDKGYKSVDMLKRVGNARYFDGDLVTAAKWYSELFDITTDLEVEFYFRYAQSLKAVGQLEKADAMMKLFESKNP